MYPTDAPPAASPTKRLLGIDLARALAIVGMFAAHTLEVPELHLPQPSTWLGFVDGRSAALFLVLSGVSLALMTGGTDPVDGVRAVQRRLQIMIRAAVLFPLGLFLADLDTPVAVILKSYAIMFVLALPMLFWPVRRLLITAAGIALLMPIVAQVLEHTVSNMRAFSPYRGLGDGSVIDFFFGGMYPPMTLLAYVLLGIALGRMNLRELATQRLLVGIGVGVALLGWALAAISRAVAGPRDTVMIPMEDLLTDDSGSSLPDLTSPDVLESILNPPGASPWQWRPSLLRQLTGNEPHANVPFELIGNAGIATAAIAICLVLLRGRTARPEPGHSTARERFFGFGVWTPLIAFGSMALTEYTGQIIALAFVADEGAAGPVGFTVFAWLTIVGILAAWGWKAYFTRGPLEQLLATLGRRASSTEARR